MHHSKPKQIFEKKIAEFGINIPQPKTLVSMAFERRALVPVRVVKNNLKICIILFL